MKKLISLMLAFAMIACIAVGCAPAANNDGNDNEEKGNEVQTVEALTALQTAWNALGDDEKPFAMGGGYETIVDNAPGSVPTTDEAYLTSILLVPADEVSKISAAASVMHAMNTNTFCAGAFNLVDGADYSAFAAALREAIQGNRWMCGFPEKLYIANVGNCLVVAYGNAEIVDTFCGKLENATAIYDEAIEG